MNCQAPPAPQYPLASCLTPPKPLLAPVCAMNKHDPFSDFPHIKDYDIMEVLIQPLHQIWCDSDCPLLNQAHVTASKWVSLSCDKE